MTARSQQHLGRFSSEDPKLQLQLQLQPKSRGRGDSGTSLNVSFWSHGVAPIKDLFVYDLANNQKKGKKKVRESVVLTACVPQCLSRYEQISRMQERGQWQGGHAWQLTSQKKILIKYGICTKFKLKNWSSQGTWNNLLS